MTTIICEHGAKGRVKTAHLAKPNEVECDHQEIEEPYKMSDLVVNPEDLLFTSK